MDEFKDNNDDKRDSFGIDDAFGFRPEQPSTGYDPGAPAPQTSYRQVKRKDTARIVLTAVLAVFLAAALFMGGFFTHYLSMRKEMKVLNWAFDLIDKHYIGDDVQGRKQSVEDYLDAAGKGLENALDPYSAFYTPRELEQMYAEMQAKNADFGWNFKGVYDSSGKLVNVAVHSVVGSSPAEAAGVQKDDILLSVNGVAVDVSSAEALQKTLWDALDVALNATVTVVFARPNWDAAASSIRYEELTMSVQLKEYSATYVKYKTNADEGYASLPDSAMYLKLAQFEGVSGKTEFPAAMAAFAAQGKKDLILDLRDNGGGYLEVCKMLANYLVTKSGSKHQLFMSAKYKSGKPEKWETDEALYGSTGFERIVVLVNDGTASASEVLLGAMRDCGTLTAMVGTTTYGKGIMQDTFQHPTGYALKLTVARWYTPNGDNIQGTGFTPEGDDFVSANPTNYPYTAAGDSELNRAVAILNGAV